MHSARTDRERPTLKLFGGPLLHRSPGVPVPLTPLHARLLTLVWGHEERGLSRAAAIELLWGEEDAPRSRQRLRQLLHDLATRLGFRPVAGDEGRLVPASTVLASDLEEFLAAVETRQVAKALSLFSLGFASGLDGRTGGEEYDDWLLSKRERLRRLLREAAGRLWDQSRPTAAWREARAAAEVLAALDPESEATVLKLVEARAMTGSLHEAEQAAADYQARLPAGPRATREITSLLDRIRHLDVRPTAAGPRHRSQVPFVGRRQAMVVARRALDRVAGGAFEFVLIRGEGGAGKSRLMEEIRKEASLNGFRCLEAKPVELERRIPLNPLVDMLGHPSVSDHIRNLEEPWRAVIASLLPTLPTGMSPPVVPPIAEASLSRRLYDAFATLLSAMAESGPHLLFIDDLQWVDATTVAVLQFVQRRWQSGPLGVVAAVRPDLVSGADETARYLTASADLPVTAIELGDLSPSEARKLLDLVAETEVEPAAAARLMALGGRNPFYLIELTRDYLDGKVQLPGLPTEAITLPISVRQLLEPRVKELGQDAANVAAHLAVWGRTLPLTDLAGLLGSGIESTVELVEELERCRLASVDLGMVGLAHELFRSTIYQGLSATRRSFLHGRVAEFQDRSEDPEPGEIAIHFAQAGNAPGAAHRGREAADRALESGAMAEAAYFLQVVVENVGDARLKAEATADLARVLHMNRDINRANPLLELASSRLRAVGNEALALRMDIRRVEGLAELGAAPLSELLDRLATIKALARAADDDEALALALDSELHLLHRSGKVSEIRTLFQEIRPLTSSRDQAAACLANAALALNVLFGDADEALRCAREAVRLADEGAAGRHMLHACSRLTLVLIYQGQLCTPEGQIVLSRATSIAQRSGDLTLRAYVELNQGVFAMEIGDFSQADEHFQKTENVLGQSLPGLPHVTLYYNQGELLLREGRYGEARQAFSRGESVCTAATPTYLVHLLSAGIGLSSLEVGDLSLARDRDALIRIDVGDPYFDPTIILDFRSRLMARRGHGDLVLDEIEAAAVAVRSRLPLVWLKLTLLAARLRRRLGLPPPSWATEALRIAESLPRYHLMDAFRGLRLQPR